MLIIYISRGTPSDDDEHDDGDDGDQTVDEDYGPVPDCSGLYTTLEPEAAHDDIQPECVDKYLAQAFQRNLTKSIDKYNKIMVDDYTRKFNVYHDLIRDQSWQQIKKYVLCGMAEGGTTPRHSTENAAMNAEPGRILCTFIYHASEVISVATGNAARMKTKQCLAQPPLVTYQQPSSVF